MEPSVNKKISFFLSSTFNDLQGERDALVKLFRELSVEGKRRGITLKLLDLRWGVTDDQKRNGKVIYTCLQEIDNSRPFFIGIIGDRYGWVPSEEEILMNSELCDKFPQVKACYKKGQSITEIEMRYGIQNSTSKMNSLFLIKNNANIENLRHKELRDYLCSPEIPHIFYGSIEEMVHQVRNTVMNLLNNSYPVLSDLSELEKIEFTQKIIFQGNRDGYISYGNYLKELDDWLKGSEQNLVITGETGCGKSALISEWIAKNNFHNYNVIYHFIGNLYGSASYLDVQRHILTRIESHYNLTPTLPLDPDSEKDYYIELENVLEAISKKNEKWLFIIDGLEHLENDPMTKLLSWFPEMPGSIKVLFTTNPNDLTYKRLCHAKKYKELYLPFLDKDSSRAIIRKYLSSVGKSLEERLINRIADVSLFHNPYLLRLLLDELVTYGFHEKIAEIVEEYASSTTKTDFFNKILSHAENYYGYSLIKDVLMLIAVVKDGLAETDVIEILDLQPLDWSMVFCGLQRLFVFVNGKYLFVDKDLYTIVTSHYNCSTAENNDETIYYINKAVAHLENNNSDNEELAFLYYSSGNWEKLYSLIIDPELALNLLLHSEIYFANYWNYIMEHTNHNYYDYLSQDYKMLQDWEPDDQLFSLSQFVELQFGDTKLAIRFIEKANDYLMKQDLDKNNKSNQYALAGNFTAIALYYIQLSLYDLAEDNLNRAISIYEDLNEPIDSHILFAKGNIANAKGFYNDALSYFLEACEKEEDDNGEIPWKYLNNAGLEYLYMEQYEEALEYFQKALDLIRRDLIEDTLEGANVLNNIGLVFYKTDKLDEAKDLFEKSLNIYAMNIAGGNSMIAMTLNNLGLIYQKQDKIEEAIEYFKEALQMQEEINEDTSCALFAINLGNAFILNGDYENGIQFLNSGVAIDWEILSLENDIFATGCLNLLHAYFEINDFNNLISFSDLLIEKANYELGKMNEISGVCHLLRGKSYIENSLNRKKITKELKEARKIFHLFEDSDQVKEIDELIVSL